MKLKDNLNPKYTQLSLYVIVTCIIIYILSRIADHMNVILTAIGNGLGWVFMILKPAAWGFFFAYFLAPAVDFCERHFSSLGIYKKKQKSARGLAVAVTVIAAAAIIALLLSIVISTVTNEVKVASVDSFFTGINSFVNTLNNFYNELLSRLNQMNISSSTLESYVTDAGNQLAQWIKGISNSLVTSLTNLKEFFTNLIFSIIFSIYFLLDGNMLAKYWNRVFDAISSKRFNKAARTFFKDADLIFSGYIR